MNVRGSYYIVKIKVIVGKLRDIFRGSSINTLLYGEGITMGKKQWQAT